MRKKTTQVSLNDLKWLIRIKYESRALSLIGLIAEQQVTVNLVELVGNIWKKEIYKEVS